MSKFPTTNSYNPETISYRPYFYNMANAEDADTIIKIAKKPETVIHNTIEKQIAELIRIENPSSPPRTPDEVKQKITERLQGIDIDSYGIWVYYPWSKQLVHLLDKEAFIKVRTNRNLYKISPEEVALLQTKTIAIIGLSVGQSIAHTIATERVCGELRLADFDILELGNLNRLNAGVQDMGLPKVVIAARKIAELDPYIDIKCWPEGISDHNIDSFLTDGGKADILVEECDSFDIKIFSRVKAKELGIPVIMDTNDKGMIDVERFDLEKDRAIFHGRLAELEQLPPKELIAQLKSLTFEEKVGYLSKIIGFENISDEMKFSLAQMNKTITGWPQLASAVTLGAAAITDTCRRILLRKLTNSGRFFVHFDELIK